MESYLNTSLIYRDPPSIGDVQDLANVYSNSRELFKSGSISITELEHYKPLGVLINKTTLLICTSLPIMRYFSKELLDQQKLISVPYHYLLLDVTNVDFNLASLEYLLQMLPSEKKIAVFNDWRKAILCAMLYATGKKTLRGQHNQA